MHRAAPSAFALLLALAPSLPAQPDPARAAAELARALDRPAGTTIGAEQKAALAAFLERYAGQDLGALGYAPAMARYLDRDIPGAVALLDEFFARHASIEHREHRQVAGRIYLSALAGAARAGSIDVPALHRHAERAARLYGDLGTLARVVRPLLASERVADKAGLRTALLRGACAGEADAAGLDGFAAALYSEVPPPPAPAPAGRQRQRPELAGQPAPPWSATEVVRADGVRAPLSSRDLLGKVVVLDFFASWCPPCRAAIPHLVELQQRHAGELQVVGLTHCYGRGMDFSAPGAELPHGGTPLEGLTPAAEVGLYRPFVKAFGIPYPIAFVAEDVMASYGVTAIPTFAVIDANGRIAGVQTGADVEGLEALVQKALRGR